MTVIGTIPQYTIPAEPPNKSIVGWGDPIEAVYVRIDEQVYAGRRDERWFEAVDPALEAPLSWEAVCDANASSGLPYLLNREPLVAEDHVPDNLIELVGLTDTNQRLEDVTAGVQFSVLDPDGKRKAYGDQRYVAFGDCIQDGHPEGRIQRRTITITYSDWVDHHAPGSTTS